MATYLKNSISLTSAHSSLAIRLLRETISHLGWRYALFVAASVGFGLVALLPPQLFRYFTEGAPTLSSLSAEQFLTNLALFGVLISTVLLFVSMASTLSNEWLRLRLEADLRKKTLRRLHQLPLATLDGAQRGDWLTRMTGDLARVELFLHEDIPYQIRQGSILIGSGILFLVHSGMLAVLPLATAVVIALVNVYVQRRLAPVLAELRTLHGGVFQLLIESLEGIRTIRSHAVEPYVQRRFEGRLTEITSKSMRVVRYLGLLMGGTDFTSQMMVTACLTAAAWTVSRGTMTLEQVLVYPFFIGMFYNSAQSLAGASYDWNRYLIEAGRLAELIYGDQGATPFYSPTRQVDFSQASLMAVRGIVIGHESRMLAGPIDFRLERGKLWAVMGASGCGKSTFLEVLAGLRPAMQGNVVLEGEDGRSLWEAYARGSVKLPIGPCAFVEQRPYIFEGSLRENLTFGNPDRLTDTTLWAALESASLYHFARFHGGLDHVLKDRGRNLSEGERYRIALCRALLLRRPFLLLDEPFAALDETSVEVVIATLEREKPSRGIVVVTHYLPDDFDADGIMRFNGTLSRIRSEERVPIEGFKPWEIARKVQSIPDGYPI